ncbi:MAG: glycoside hydrolase family 44 protein [Pyrinomonadaceae bacterium]
MRSVHLSIVIAVGLMFSTYGRAQVAITVDAAADRRPINPMIYGTAFATTAQLLDLNSPLNRHGGNATTRYNWQQNATNRANDWYFQSLDDGSPTSGDAGDAFIQLTKNGAAQPAITIPIIDWVAKLGPGRQRLASFSIAKYGAQTGNDSQWFPDAGNGIKTNGQFVTGNDKNDANTPNSVALQQGWMQHLINRWGNSSGAGVKNYILDNEHSIWFSTHRDVMPVGSTMDELFARMRDHAAMIRSQDPTATIWGPEEWGWNGYLFSGYDQWFASPSNGYERPDRAAHGNMDYMPWLLQQFKDHETQTGTRVLDVFTLHYYPQGGETNDDVSAAMQARRNRSTRSLWDPNYTDESWINAQVKLIPRMKAWVAQNYPNTKIGITEYNWGAENHINGATTQADIYGIFGREGLDIGTRWTTPATGSLAYNAMKMYRNYDGNKSGFGDTSVRTAVPNPDAVSAFAAERSVGGALTIMVINKEASSKQASVTLQNFPAQSAVHVWQLTSANQITQLPNAAVVSNSISTSLPAQSITLLIVSPNALAAPTSLIGRRFSNIHFLSWNDMTSDEDGFVIERSQNGGPFVEIFRTAANKTSYQRMAKWGSTQYRVRTRKGGTLSEPSNVVQIGN